MADAGLTTKDAKTLVSLDGGERLDYYDEILNQIGYSTHEIWRAALDDASSHQGRNSSTDYLRQCGKTAANWFEFPSYRILHLTNFLQ